MTVTQWMYRIAFILFLVIFTIGVIILFVPKRNEYRKLQQTRDKLVQQNELKAQQIKDLKIKQERFTTEPSFVERTAREAGMVSKDEVVYRFKDADSDNRR